MAQPGDLPSHRPSHRAVGWRWLRQTGKGDGAPLAASTAGTGSLPGLETRFDLCVIGAGPGGLSVAAAAAQLGVSVVLVEKHKMGGDCLNYGCVPSKALIAAARRAHAHAHGGAVRHRGGRPAIDLAAVASMSMA